MGPGSSTSPRARCPGYAGIDLESFDGFDWTGLRRATGQVLDLAEELGVWVVLGSAHQLGRGHKPHNSLYVIDPNGDIVDRYDKRFCSGDAAGRSGDLAHYTPGDHPSTWEIDGVRCGALICYDYRFPELYREYERAGVRLVLHSFHAANASAAAGDAPSAMRSVQEHRQRNPAATFTYPAITMPATMTAAAASNHIWISCSNSSARESLWPAFARAGRRHHRRPACGATGRASCCRRSTPTLPLYDSTRDWRGRAMDGVLHSGTLVDDPRSSDRTDL